MKNLKKLSALMIIGAAVCVTGCGEKAATTPEASTEASTETTPEASTEASTEATPEATPEAE